MVRRTLDLPNLLPGSPDCDSCSERVAVAVAALPGVERVTPQPDRSALVLEFEPRAVTYETILQKARTVAGEIARTMEHARLTLGGLDCPDCALTIERSVGNLPGVARAAANFASSSLSVEFERDRVTLDDVRRRVEQLGYRVVMRPDRLPPRLAVLRDPRARLTLLSGVLLAVGGALYQSQVPALWSNAVFGTALAAGGLYTARAGWAALWSRRLDMNVLMVVGATGAAVIGQWAEGATVIFLFALGNAIEAHTVERARHSVRALMQLAPDTAQVLVNGQVRDTALEAIQPGDVIILQPGQRVPLDGEISSGATEVDEATLTGEAAPVAKGPGDKVFAGTINQSGAVEVRVTAPASETVLSRVIRLVEHAQAQKAPRQRAIDRFAGIYTPIVIGIAVLVVFALPLAGWAPFIDSAHPPHGSVYRALALLVLACPCALVISTPVAIISGLVAAARMGVLIKGGVFLEQAGRLTTVAFDKTGTITRGRQEVTAVVPVADVTEESLVALAAGVESRSEHPLGKALVRCAAHRQIAPLPVADFRAVPGLGARGRVNDEPCFVGSPRLFAELGAPTDALRAELAAHQAQGETVILVGTRERVLGYFRLVDQPRPEAAQALADLRRAGVERMYLVTGDHAAAAARVAQTLPFDEVAAGLLPEQKIEFVRSLVQRYGDTAMVGDGVNDAPALAAANLGVAMGSIGSDVALETADVALMTDDLSRLPAVVRLGRRTLGIIGQNIAFSVLVKAGLLSLVFGGHLTLWLAVAGDMGTSLLVTLNGLRALQRPR